MTLFSLWCHLHILRLRHSQPPFWLWRHFHYDKIRYWPGHTQHYGHTLHMDTLPHLMYKDFAIIICVNDILLVSKEWVHENYLYHEVAGQHLPQYTRQIYDVVYLGWWTCPMILSMCCWSSVTQRRLVVWHKCVGGCLRSLVGTVSGCPWNVDSPVSLDVVPVIGQLLLLSDMLLSFVCHSYLSRSFTSDFQYATHLSLSDRSLLDDLFKLKCDSTYLNTWWGCEAAIKCFWSNIATMFINYIHYCCCTAFGFCVTVLKWPPSNFAKMFGIKNLNNGLLGY